jgi:DNA-binding beta-propeller fold protein YncE
MSTRTLVCGVTLLCCCAALGCSSPDHSAPVLNPGLGSNGAEPTSAAGGSSILLPPSATGEALFAGALVKAEHVAPVVGGTLLVTIDGATIVAADPDRDAVFLVDVQSKAVRSVALNRGDEPGRVAEGPAGTVYVALRRAGALISIDLASATVSKRVPVCASPRGVAYDAASASVYVACRSGQLSTLAAADLTQKRVLQLDTDLRDVIVRPNDLVLTRFLSAEVLVVANDGSVSRRAAPDPQPGCGEATVAFRALALSTGQIAIAHQGSSDQVVVGGSGGYGFSCGGSLVNRFLSLVDVDHASTASTEPPAPGVPQDPAGQSTASPMTFDSAGLPGAGPLDVAIDRGNTRVAAIALDDSLTLDTSDALVGGQPAPSPRTANLWLAPWTGQGVPAFNAETGGAPLAFTIPGQPVAVAFQGVAEYIVQSREPATLEFQDGSSVTLSTESHADTGQRMFYMNSGIGISCSSCHPEGGEDGHVWRFNEGLRRTMPLEGGVMERAPFHWDGSLGDMNALVNEVMINRMALPATPSAEQVGALGSFLEQLPALPGPEGLDAAAVKRGEALFRRADVACASCHSGPQYTNNQMADVGTGGQFSTPSLLGVGLRSALFHDGCAKSIAERFGPCGGSAHGKPELLSAAEQADMIVFLRSL